MGPDPGLTDAPKKKQEWTQFAQAPRVHVSNQPLDPEDVSLDDLRLCCVCVCVCAAWLLFLFPLVKRKSTRMFLFGIKDGRVSCSHASWGCRFASNSIGIRANSYRIRNLANWHPQPSCLPSSTISLRPPCHPPSFLLNARERVPCAFRTFCPFVEYYNSLTWQKRRELGLMGYYYPMKDKLLDAMYSVFKGVCPLLPCPRAEHNVSCWLDGHPERASGTAVRRHHETWETILLQNETIAFPLHRHLLNTSTP